MLFRSPSRRHFPCAVVPLVRCRSLAVIPLAPSFLHRPSPRAVVPFTLSSLSHCPSPCTVIPLAPSFPSCRSSSPWWRSVLALACFLAPSSPPCRSFPCTVFPLAPLFPLRHRSPRAIVALGGGLCSLSHASGDRFVIWRGDTAIVGASAHFSASPEGCWWFSVVTCCPWRLHVPPSLSPSG